jgi:hypothetical protein
MKGVFICNEIKANEWAFHAGQKKSRQWQDVFLLME